MHAGHETYTMITRSYGGKIQQDLGWSRNQVKSDDGPRKRPDARRKAVDE